MAATIVGGGPGERSFHAFHVLVCDGGPMPGRSRAAVEDHYKVEDFEHDLIAVLDAEGCVCLQWPWVALAIGLALLLPPSPPILPFSLLSPPSAPPSTHLSSLLPSHLLPLPPPLPRLLFPSRSAFKIGPLPFRLSLAGRAQHHRPPRRPPRPPRPSRPSRPPQRGASPVRRGQHVVSLAPDLDLGLGLDLDLDLGHDLDLDPRTTRQHTHAHARTT